MGITNLRKGLMTSSILKNPVAVYEPTNQEKFDALVIQNRKRIRLQIAIEGAFDQNKRMIDNDRK